MKDGKDVLFSLIKTSQMGQIGIRSVLNMPIKQELKDTLRKQLQGYQEIEQEAMTLAKHKGWKADELNPVVMHMSNMMVRTRLLMGDVNGKAATMMIHGTVKGIIKGHKNLNQLAVSDERIRTLSQKLLQQEEQNIHQLQGFL